MFLNKTLEFFWKVIEGGVNHLQTKRSRIQDFPDGMGHLCSTITH